MSTAEGAGKTRDELWPGGSAGGKEEGRVGRRKAFRIIRWLSVSVLFYSWRGFPMSWRACPSVVVGGDGQTPPAKWGAV